MLRLLGFSGSLNKRRVGRPKSPAIMHRGSANHFMGGLFPIVPVLLRLAPDVAAAFRDGSGGPFEKFGPEGVFGLDVMNRGQYEHRLTSYWLRAMPDVQVRLEAGGRALDVGCGAGRGAGTLATAFPKATVGGPPPA